MDDEREMLNLLDRDNFRSEAPESLKADIMRRVRSEPAVRDFRLPILRLAVAVAIFLVSAVLLYPRLTSAPEQPAGNPDIQVVQNSGEIDNVEPIQAADALDIDGLRDEVSKKFNWLVYEGGGKETIKQEKERLVRFSGKMTAEITTAVVEVGSTTRTVASKLSDPVSLITGAGGE